MPPICSSMPAALKRSAMSDSVYNEAETRILQRGCDDRTPKECMERFLNATCTFQLLRQCYSLLCVLKPGSMEDLETGTFALSLFWGHEQVCHPDAARREALQLYAFASCSSWPLSGINNNCRISLPIAI